MTWLLALPYALFCAFVWRLRGGAWQVVGINMGTQVTRIVTAVLMTFPILAATWDPTLSGLVGLELLLGMILAGWGPYMAMGVQVGIPQSRSWIDVFPRLLGRSPETLGWDAAGMFACGSIMGMLLSFPVALSTHSLLSLLLIPVVGSIMLFAYWLPTKVDNTEWPTIIAPRGVFAGPGTITIGPNYTLTAPRKYFSTQWSEIIVGFLLGLVIWAVFILGGCGDNAAAALLREYHGVVTPEPLDVLHHLLGR